MNIVNVGYDSTNYYVLGASTNRLLIDVGWPGTLPRLLATLKRKDIALQEIGYLLITHYHPDHAGLAQEVKTNGVRLIVLKQQPLGGVGAALEVAEAAGVPAVVSSMMETSVGIAAGVALAAARPELPHACGLATATMIVGDVTLDPLVPVEGRLAVRAVEPDPELLARYSVDPSQEDSR